MLINYLNKHRAHIALSANGKRLRYHDLKNRVLQLADALKRMDIKPGDRIGLCGEVSIEYICVLYAIIYCGGIVVPYNTRLPAAEIQKSIDSVNCKLVFVSKDWEKKITHAKRLDFLYSDIDFSGEKVNKTNIDQDVSILFTSGSSGRPKAVLHTLGNHYYSALGSNKNLPLGPGNRWLLSVPMFHIAGVAICMRALFSGATVVIPDKNKSTAQIIETEMITHISLVPTQLYRLLQGNDFKWIENLEAVLLGGGPIAPSLIKKALHYKVPLFTSYGSTEMASQITTSGMNAGFDELNTAGYPLLYREIKINDGGEILVKGKTMAAGYIQNDRIDSITDKLGWFHTGDCGKLDDKGRLLVSGRLDNMFISGGENIFPEEIERVLCGYAGVENAVVVPVPDEEFGERPAAFICWENEEEADYNALEAYVRELLAGYMLPVKWFHWPRIQTNTKADRRLFKKLAIKTTHDF